MAVHRKRTFDLVFQLCQFELQLTRMLLRQPGANDENDCAGESDC